MDTLDALPKLLLENVLQMAIHCFGARITGVRPCRYPPTVVFDRTTEWIINRGGRRLLQKLEAMSDAQLSLLRNLGTIERAGAWIRGLPFEDSWEANEAFETDNIDDPPPPYTHLPAASVLCIATPQELTSSLALTNADKNRMQAARLASIQRLQDAGSDRTANQIIAPLARPTNTRQAEYQQRLILRAIPPPCPRGGVMHFTGEECSRCCTRNHMGTFTAPSGALADAQTSVPSSNLESLAQFVNGDAATSVIDSEPSPQT